MSKTDKPVRKPLLFGESYGDDVARLLERTEEMQGDAGWVPGYSEQVRANEISRVDPTLENFTTDRRMKTAEGKQLRDHYLQQYGAPKPLPIRLKWVRVVGMDGSENQNVRTDMVRYLADGYRPIKLDELRAYGYDMPPAATIDAEGLIRRGDVALMAVDAERALANDARKARDLAEREQATTSDAISVERRRESNHVL